MTTPGSIDKLRIVSQNVARGGTHRADGTPIDRFGPTMEVIAEAAADIVLLQEAKGWAANGHALLVQACQVLGMTTFGLVPSRDGYPTTVLWNPARVTLKKWNADCSTEALKGFVLATFDIGATKPLTVVPLHLSPYGYEHAAPEAHTIASRAWRYDNAIIIGGDFNYPPADAGNPEPDYTAMKPWNIGSRTIEATVTDPDGTERTVLRPDRRVSNIFRRKGFTDIGWHLYQQTGDTSYLEKTGSDDRIDRFEASAAVVPAVVDQRRLETKRRGGSDHDGQLLIVDPARIDTASHSSWD